MQYERTKTGNAKVVGMSNQSWSCHFSRYGESCGKKAFVKGRAWCVSGTISSQVLDKQEEVLNKVEVRREIQAEEHIGKVL